MFRVFGSSPPPGPARDQLHRSALSECMAVCRILGPLAAEDPRIDDVGITFWAASNLANYHLKGGAADQALSYAEAAVDLVQEAALRDPDEPEYKRWRASGMVGLAEAQAAVGDHAAAMASLGASIEIVRVLYQTLPTAGRRRDFREAVESAVKVSERWATTSSTERQRWVELFNTLA
jgi:tetratricopeptide (TPR) repeat protein